MTAPCPCETCRKWPVVCDCGACSRCIHNLSTARNLRLYGRHDYPGQEAAGPIQAKQNDSERTME